MVKQTKITVILTSYNHAKYLRESIDSVLNQTFSDFELIIVDDASTDESWQIIKSYSDSRIQAFRSEFNTKAGGDLRKVISEVVPGGYIAIHHSDDVWEPNKLEKQAAFLDANPQIGAVFSKAFIIDENSDLLEDQSHFYYRIFDQPNRNRYEWLNFFFYNGNALCHPSVLIRNVCYDACGLYRFGFAQLADFDMWVRLCLKYDIYILPEKLVRFRVRSNEMNASGNRPEVRIRGKFEFFQILNNYRSIRTSEDFIKVFPHANEYFRQEDFDIDFALGMVSLEPNMSNFAKLFGLQLLFESLNNPDRRKKLNELYGFNPSDFIELSGKFDVFLVELNPELTPQVADMEQVVKRLSCTVSEREKELLVIYHSRAWQIAMILRKVSELLIPNGSRRAHLAEKVLAMLNHG
jgi:glycosyltransferase involved in cell wall biosynthesis